MHPVDAGSPFKGQAKSPRSCSIVSGASPRAARAPSCSIHTPPPKRNRTPRHVARVGRQLRSSTTSAARRSPRSEKGWASALARAWLSAPVRPLTAQRLASWRCRAGPPRQESRPRAGCRGPWRTRRCPRRPKGRGRPTRRTRARKSEASRGPLRAGRGARASALRAATAESSPSARCRVPTRVSLRAWRCATARAVADRIALGERRGGSPAARRAIAFACRRRFAFSFRRVDLASAVGASPTPAAAEAAGAEGPRGCATAGWAGVGARRGFA